MYDKDSIRLGCSLTSTSVRSGREVPLHVVVQVESLEDERAKARDVLLLLDLSSLLLGPSLPQRVRAAEQLLAQLGGLDRVGLVSFESRLEVPVPLSPLTPAVRERLVSRLRSFAERPRSTERPDLCAALRQAAGLFENAGQGVIRSLVVLSAGQTEARAALHEAGSELFRTVHELHALGLDVSFVSVDLGSKQVTLMSATEGHLARGSADGPPAPGARPLHEALRRPLTTGSLCLTPGEDTVLGRVIGGLPARVGPEGLEIALPELHPGDTCTVVVEAWLRAWRQGPWRVVKATMRGTSAAGVQLHEQAEAWAEVTDHGAVQSCPDVLEAVDLARSAERLDRPRLAARPAREVSAHRRRTRTTAHACLRFLDGPRRGDVVSLERLRMVLGRAEQEAAAVALPGLEEGQAILEQFGGEVWIFDLSSSPGLRVNGRDVRCHHLIDGDRITLHGHGPLLFEKTSPPS